jgi:spore coat polysaccharide biosynthesis protein SpsF (cytidylyltransferase family)
MKHEFSFIIQARSASTRLPGKILIPFYNDETILDIQLKNISKSFPSALVIIATSINKADDVIVAKYKDDKRVKIFRGDENNVLKRFIDAAKQFEIEHIVRVCSDNPFLSMPHIKELIDFYFSEITDYASFRFMNGTPAIKSHSGLFAEVVSLKTLEKVQKQTQEQLFLEHVTNYVYTHPEQFKATFLPVPTILDAYIEKLRLTIDTQLDFGNLQKLYLAVLSKYNAGFTIEQLLTEVNADKDLLLFMKEQIKNYAK